MDYIQIATDFMVFLVRNEEAFGSALVFLNQAADEGMDLVGARGAFDEFLASGKRDDVATVAVAMRSKAETLYQSDEEISTMLACGAAAIIAVVSFGSLGVYEPGSVGDKAFRAAARFYGFAQALREKLWN
ncbi:hypothetical protein [Chelatococcus composti]|jgi:hypothetical protein|uniref:Uncharacterized protein n=1 Tax=Chelatococcus composti TaxID=1743235 RepID=A0A841K4D1_9HYPH|nr:hypothetical protein [Chelatococcus composti]MBB6167155.1 hypothetical protein [Chelatococcus composti]MBS7735364.1 hypothetical protein [Chelatococcus composti]GGG29682.1 hypothetical protein GCM10008026_07710 [Chelatococcus composti]